MTTFARAGIRAEYSFGISTLAIDPCVIEERDGELIDWEIDDCDELAEFMSGTDIPQVVVNGVRMGFYTGLLDGWIEQHILDDMDEGDIED